MERAKGFEPGAEGQERIEGKRVAENGKTDLPRQAPQNSGQGGEDVSDVVLAWANLPEKVRAAILALVKSAKGGRP
jgi:hypothetical protein